MSASSRALVLVPGAWHGAWCWERLAPLLESAGQQVIQPELSGTGADTTDPAQITLETWVQQLRQRIQQQSTPVILVGHSRAGVIISRVAELIPEHIHRLVYLAGYLLTPGGSVAEAARADTGSLIAANMQPADRGITCTLTRDIAHQAFYADCDPQIARTALDRLRPEPLKPLVTRLKVSAERFGRVPRAYVECTRDRTLSLAAQRQMQQALPCDPVLTLDSGHSPFLSHPAELAAWLGRL